MSLTARAITFAQECGLFNLIHVSTDDEEIAAEAERFDSPVVFFDQVLQVLTQVRRQMQYVKCIKFLQAKV